jgi:basic membrane protein A
LVLAACGGKSPSTSNGASPAATGAKKAALVIAQGGLGDGAYNDLAYKGFKEAAAASGVKGAPVESADVVAQGEQLVRRAASSDYGLIVDLEFSHGDILKKLAPEYPKVKFAILNLVVDAPNVASLLFKEHEGSYLAGVLAAGMTTVSGNPKVNAQKKIGVIGGTKSTGIDKFIAGFIQGAHSVDPSMTVDVKYTNSFGDVAKGKQTAEQMYAAGDDVIYQVAGGAGAGVIEAAKATNHYAIGVDSDQDSLAPGFVLTSMIKRTDLAVADAVKKFADGSFPAGQTITYGLKEGGVGLSSMTHTKKDVPADLIAKVTQAADDITSGKLKVWDVTAQGYPSWFKG